MNDKKNTERQDIQGMIGMLYRALVFMISLLVIMAIGILMYATWGDQLGKWFEEDVVVERPARQAPTATREVDLIENGIHVATGLIVAEGFEEVKATCTACHSAQLVTQNRATREGWREMIRWMQETQGLWELGDQEPLILDYLAANYAPEEVGRRASLDVEAIEWYVLEEVE